MIDAKALTTLAPKLQNADDWAAGLQKTFDKFAIDTPKRVAAFLAQTIFESNYFTELAENLNYSEQGLLKTFPTHFNPEQAANYAHKPEQIANRAYANRNGNGPETSGNGWSYRGRGMIQLTFKDNYQSFGNAIGMNLTNVPAYLETVEGACMSAGWFWSVHGLNALADADQFTNITIRINGGTNGLDDRKALWAKVQPLAEA